MLCIPSRYIKSGWGKSGYSLPSRLVGAIDCFAVTQWSGLGSLQRPVCVHCVCPGARLSSFCVYWELLYWFTMWRYCWAILGPWMLILNSVCQVSVCVCQHRTEVERNRKTIWRPNSLDISGIEWGYPHHILNKHNKSVDNTKSGGK